MQWPEYGPTVALLPSPHGCSSLIDRLNTLIHHHTTLQIATLQIAILQTVLQGHQHANLTQPRHCTKNHLKDKTYSL